MYKHSDRILASVYAIDCAAYLVIRRHRFSSGLLEMFDSVASGELGWLDS